MWLAIERDSLAFFLKAVFSVFNPMNFPGVERTVPMEALRVGWVWGVGWVGCLGFFRYIAFFKVVVLAFEEIVLVGDKRHQSVPEIGFSGDVQALRLLKLVWIGVEALKKLGLFQDLLNFPNGDISNVCNQFKCVTLLKTGEYNLPISFLSP